MRLKRCIAAWLGMLQLTATAAPSVTPVANSGPSWAGLVFVFTLLGLVAWGAKRYGKKNRAASVVIKVIGGCSLGGKERIAVVEVAGQWLVVGVAQGSVSTLASMAAPKQQEHDTETKSESFSAALDKLNTIMKPDNNAR